MNLIVGLVCSLFELITGTAFQMSKESSSDENIKDMSGVTFRIMSAKPYLKSFLEDQNRTSDFKEFYNYVAVPFQKIIQKVEDNKANIGMTMLATEGIALESALMSITNTPLIKHHYDFLNGLVEKSKILLHKKTEEHKQMLRAEIAPTYSSMALDKIQNKVTYYDRITNKRLVVKMEKDSKIGTEETRKTLEEYIDNKYVPKRLGKSLGPVLEFISSVKVEKSDQSTKQDLDVSLITHPD